VSTQTPVQSVLIVLLTILGMLGIIAAGAAA
jgi:hypothetical protein